MIIAEKYLVHLYSCVFYIEDYIKISVLWTDVWSKVQQDLLLFFFFWSYLGCTPRSVHRDDRIATGSGNISDERFRGEVVTTFGMRFVFLCWPHLLRVTLITAQIKIWQVIFSLCKIDSSKSPANSSLIIRGNMSLCQFSRISGQCVCCRKRSWFQVLVRSFLSGI